MMGVILVNTSVTPDYFYNELSLIEAKYIFEAIKNKQRQQYEHTRLIAYHSIMPHLKKQMDIKEFMPFADEEKNTITPEQIEKQKEDYDNLLNKLNLQKFDAQQFNN